jgi:transposase
MMVIGIDAHKRSHTAVMVDNNGREHATKTVGTTTQDHLRLLKWANALHADRLWAIEDCRHLTRRLERDLIAAGDSEPNPANGCSTNSRLDIAKDPSDAPPLWRGPIS